MRRHLAVSTALGLGLVAMTASAQPPAGDKAPPPKPAEKKAPEKKADPVEGLIESALANDPDVRLARAKIALAEAELTKARQGVAVKVTTVRATVLELRSAVEMYQERTAWAERMAKQKYMSEVQAQAEKDKLEAARVKLAGAEAELKLLVGDGPRAAAPPADPTPLALAQLAARNQFDYAVALTRLAAQRRPADPAVTCNHCHDVARDGDLLGKDWHGCVGIHQYTRATPPAPKGPIPDRLRAALDKTVSLGAKDAKVTFEQAVEAFKKDAGLDVPVRAEVKVSPVVSLGESLPVGAWLQLFADGTPGTRLLVREYGLLVTTKELAPPDGVSVFDLWKQKPAAAKPAPAPPG
ncbi:MAG: TolC family protein [Gemmataceae bacterium]|nr:TolC family protein [Gemmataceae bacterium]